MGGPLLSDHDDWDRFVVICPAPMEQIQQYDSSLLIQSQQQLETNENDEDHRSTIWAAVYRSNHNMPSVIFPRDEFWNAMNRATTVEKSNDGLDDQQQQQQQFFWKQSNNGHRIIDPATTTETSFMATTTTTTPVAVARLRPLFHDDVNDATANKISSSSSSWMLDSMRCVLKKDDVNMDCEGDSEHAEAIAMAIDALLSYHLQRLCRQQPDLSNNINNNNIVFSIRSKATLISSKLLEERGFVPVTELSRDMASHVASSMETCLEQYANRCSMFVPTTNHNNNDNNNNSNEDLVENRGRRLSPTARQTALQIVVSLGQLLSSQVKRNINDDDEAATATNRHTNNNNDSADDDDDYWTKLGKISL